MIEFVDGSLHVGGVAATELVRRFGSPLYVYDLELIDRQAGRIERAFASLPFRPFYAMKANGNLSILRHLAARGFGCDAVSPGEVFLARHAGFEPSRIWFTTSNLSDDDLRALGDATVVVNVNSMTDLERVIRLRVRNAVSLRINPDVGAGHHRDVVTGGRSVKFGFDVAELDDARIIAADAGLDICGLHAHIGSGVTEVGPLLESARRLVELAAEFGSLRALNFGGGLGVPYLPGEREFPIDDYGDGLAEVAGETCRMRGLTAIVEPGRYVVAQAGMLLATVTSKRISGGQEWIGVDTGFNHLVRPSKYGAYHHIVNASRGSNGDLRENAAPVADDSEGVVIAGNLCESGDVFTRDATGNAPRPLPPTSVGDILAFCDAGAYGFSMASHYNARLLPPEVLVDGGEARVIRERQRTEDLVLGQAGGERREASGRRREGEGPR
jgi:diaminopimelate decarboxylase